jgi:hypothetical protein
MPDTETHAIRRPEEPLDSPRHQLLALERLGVLPFSVGAGMARVDQQVIGSRDGPGRSCAVTLQPSSGAHAFKKCGGHDRPGYGRDDQRR